MRSDWTPISQAAQKKVLNIFLTASEKKENNKGTTTLRKNRREHEKDEFNQAEKFLHAFGRRILNTETEQLLPHVITYSPIKRHPKLYKAMPPGVAAYVDFCKREKLDWTHEWLTYDKFPWVIVPGDGPVFKRAHHPKFAKDIDRPFYIRQMLLGIRTFGLETTLEDILNTQNEALFDLVSESTEDNNAQSMGETILPYSGSDLAWKNRVKGKKRKKQLLVANQSRLNLYLEESDE